MTATWNEVRNNLGADLKILDYRVLEVVAEGKAYLSASGYPMRRINATRGTRARSIAVQKLVRLGLVESAERGETFRLTEAGDKALQAWRDSRANPAQTSTEGTPAS